MILGSLTLAFQLEWNKVFGGDSGYAFHYTPQDLGDNASLELPRYSALLAEISQGTDTFEGSVTFDETETGFISAATGFTLKTYAESDGTIVADSDQVYLRENGKLIRLTRVASAPTALQYTVTGGNKIMSHADNNNKSIAVKYRWSMQGTSSGATGTRRPVPFKLVHRFTLIDDLTSKKVPGQVTIHRALGGGTFEVPQTRKQATTIGLNIQIMEPNPTPDNPKGYAVEMIFGM